MSNRRQVPATRLLNALLLTWTVHASASWQVDDATMRKAMEDRLYWDAVIRLQSQVEQLIKLIDRMQQELPRASAQADERLEQTIERVRADIHRAIEQRETTYHQDKAESRRLMELRDEKIDALAKKVLIYGTIGGVILTLFNIYPSLVKLWSGKPS